MENIVYQGKSYTKSGFAKLLGVSSTTVSKYLKENNNDAEKVAEQLMSKKQYKYKGNIYTSDNKLSEATGIDRRTLKKLLKEIINTEERIIEVDKIVENYYNTQKTYKYKDETYKTVKEAAEAVGLDQVTLSKYLKSANGDMEKAMELFYEEHTYYIDNGIKYRTQQDLADALSVNVNTLRKYIEGEGSVEKAVQAIRARTRTEYTWKNNKYYSLESLSKAMRISRPTLKRILEDEANGNVDKAYEIYIERNKGKHQGYVYQGIKYGSIKKVLKAYGLTQQKYYKKTKEDNKKEFKKIIDELIQEKREKERGERERAEKAAIEQEKKEKRRLEKEKNKYTYQEKIYDTIVEVSEASGINRNRIMRLIEKYGNNIDIALQKEEASKTTYTYDKKTFYSIKALAEYTGKNELRLGRYIRKYNRDAEKAIFMMNLIDNRMKRAKTIPDSKMSLQDTAIILGIKYSELCTYLNSGMTIEEIKKNITPKITMNLNKHSATIMYDNSISLAQYCIDNGLNYSCIYYAITEYGKTPKKLLSIIRKMVNKFQKDGFLKDMVFY